MRPICDDGRVDVHHNGTSFPSCCELQLVEPNIAMLDGVRFDRKKRRVERLALSI